MERLLAAEVQRIRVMLVDDHRSMLWGLTRLIETATETLELVGTACTINELLEKLSSTPVDVLILDLDLDGRDASKSLPAILAATGAQVLVLTGNRDPGIHESVVINGARGVVSKDEPAEVILRAIERVHMGEVWMNRALVGRVMLALTRRTQTQLRDPAAERIASLTPREKQIVVAIVHNCGAKGMVIAHKLSMSENTLRNHLSVIYEKLEVRNRLELFAFASEHQSSLH